MLTEHRQIMLNQIEETRQAIQRKRERIRNCIQHLILESSLERQALAAQASKNGPELSFWEEHLAVKLEGIREDALRISYTHINENDWMREYSFTIDLTSREYKGAGIPTLTLIISH